MLLAGQKWVDGAAVREWLAPYVAAPGLVGAVVESPGVRPALGKDGGVIRSVRGEAGLARMAGGIVSVLVALGVPVQLVSPQRWKRGAGLIGQPKRASLIQARARFGAAAAPLLARAKDEAVAEAALIALHGHAETAATQKGAAIAASKAERS